MAGRKNSKERRKRMKKKKKKKKKKVSVHGHDAHVWGGLHQ